MRALRWMADRSTFHWYELKSKALSGLRTFTPSFPTYPWTFVLWGVTDYATMALALSSASILKPDIRLAQAVSEFEASLPNKDKVELKALKSQAQNSPPLVDDVIRLTAETDSGKLSPGRCFGPRLSNLLHTVQQFASLGDIIIGGSQNLVACGFWSLVRFTILVSSCFSISI